MKNLFFIFYITIPYLLLSQISIDDKRDYNWCFGYSQQPSLWGRNILTFQNNQLINYNTNVLTNRPLDRANVSMSDMFGNLIFYSNYFTIFNQNHQIMDNGDSLNCCTSYFDTYHNLGTGINQSILALPLPNNFFEYYVFHSLLDWGGASGISSLSLNYSIINMNLNGGIGAVTQKNTLIVTDSIAIGGLTACRHANGRDWWILIRKANSNKLHTLYFSPTGITNIGIQSIGGNVPDLIGQVCFSPDGKKYAIIGSADGIYTEIFLYDFDRCNGFLSNPIHFKIEASDPATITGASFSPNSAVLYFSSPEHLFQMDIEKNTYQLIAKVDSFQDSTLLPLLGFHLMQLAPNGKIYISGGNNRYLHIIDNPDSLGVICNLNQHFLKLRTINSRGSIPNFPNYRLGREIGSACDSIYTTISPPQGASIQVYPNPAQESITLALPQKEEAELVLLDITGRVVLSQKIRGQKETVSLGHLAKGMYFYQVENEEGILVNGKLIKE